MPPRDPDSTAVTVVSCPHCAEPVAWNASSPFRPFCSRRCRLIDLGEWFNEERRIAGEDVDADDLDEQDFGPAPRD